ncbi:MAG TPA: MBL fold metallo-hydrolase [Candidatus Sulfotelmatobacter sp.]|nr:MBL fold metallo-hydrolase [Candidatus Sulfotelmatobacter sp.]
MVEVGDGVYCLEAGGGFMRSNVHFVRTTSGWVLIDTASAGCEAVIQSAAARLLGQGVRPEAMFLTHVHPDHSGAAPALAREWDCPVYVHADELKFAIADASTFFAAYEDYASGSRSWRAPALDRSIVLPMMRLLPRGRRTRVLDRQSLKGRALAFDGGTELPYLSDWRAVATPGHTPGHVSFFRQRDGLLISGDAVVTTELNTAVGFLRWTFGGGEKRLAPPPRYFTWSRSVAEQSIAVLAELRPNVIAPGHGSAMSGADVSERLVALADPNREVIVAT